MAKITLNQVKKAEIDAQIASDTAAAGADAWFADQIAAGFTSADNIRLGLASEDVTLLTGNFVLAKEAAALGVDIPPVIDKDGVPHALEIDDLTILMLRYGQHRAALSAEYAQRKAAITE
jgi:hypothetical protein